MTADDNKCTLITSAEIKILIPYSPQQIKRMEDDGRFPNRLRLGPNKICWVREEIENWFFRILNQLEEAVRPHHQS